MTLTDTAYLRIDDGTGATATFEFADGLEETSETEKSFIMAERGQYITEIANNAVDNLAINDISTRRRGFWIDGGAGTITHTYNFETGLEDVTWGDGTGGTGDANVTETDASGAGVHPLSRKQILDYWVQRTRTDSGAQARLHWGEWTNTDFGDAGVYGQPMPVAILSLTTNSPEVDEPSSMTGSITLVHIAWWFSEDDGIPEWAQDRAQKIDDQINGVNDR